jgi:hypothetical protein
MDTYGLRIWRFVTGRPLGNVWLIRRRLSVVGRGRAVK